MIDAERHASFAPPNLACLPWRQLVLDVFAVLRRRNIGAGGKHASVYSSTY